MLTVLFLTLFLLEAGNAAKGGPWSKVTYRTGDRELKNVTSAYNLGMAQMSARDTCIAPAPKGGVEWVLHVRNSDYGWKEHTHRAMIALAINRWNRSSTEMRLMELQLHVEITNALLRNSLSPMLPNDLALYIHALVATNSNPRNFYGIDLVAELLRRVEDMRDDVHPFLVLALCNAKAIEGTHLRKIEKYMAHEDVEPRKKLELKALALKAYACAASLNRGFNKFQTQMETAVNCLILKQEADGSLGNVYTTALAVQALIASRTSKKWNEAGASNYLRRQSTVNVNLISAYYIELALNAHAVPFIKDLHPQLPIAPQQPETDERYYVQYTIKGARHPDIYFTITIKVPQQTDFYQIMTMCAREDPKFRFSSYLDHHGKPMIYAISDIPNDAEESFYWRLCLQKPVNGRRDNHKIETIRSSPAGFVPVKDSHVIFWYRETECEET